MSFDFSHRDILLGIDPSFRNLGVCIYTPSTNEMQLFTGEWFDAVEWIGKNVKLRRCVAVLENPNLDSALFRGIGIVKSPVLKFAAYQKAVGAQKWPLPAPVRFEDLTPHFGSAFRQAQSVGMNKAAGELMLKLLARHKVPTVQIAPSNRDRADKTRVPVGMMTLPTKTNAHQFKTLTGWGKRSNEHNRDAATLVWGKNIKWAIMMMGKNEEQNKAKKTRKKSKQNPLTKAAKPVPKQERKFFNVVGGEGGQRVEKVNGRFVFVEDEK